MANEQINVKMQVNPRVEVIKGMLNKVAKYFVDIDPHIRVQTSMVITELLENAIKYGSYDNDKDEVHFEIDIAEDKITLQVSNKICSRDNFDVFEKNIKKLQESDNVAKLYTERLQEILLKPEDEKSQVGLFRIAYEGKFNLQYKLNGDTLLVIAERSI